MTINHDPEAVFVEIDLFHDERTVRSRGLLIPEYYLYSSLTQLRLRKDILDSVFENRKDIPLNIQQEMKWLTDQIKILLTYALIG